MVAVVVVSSSSSSSGIEAAASAPSTVLPAAPAITALPKLSSPCQAAKLKP